MNVLYRWPDAARVGSRVPKESFYTHGKVSAVVRELFVSEVQQIVWEYKLAEVSINLPASDEVKEIQVFRIEAKSDNVSEKVLTAIDKAIPLPVIFEIVCGASVDRQVRMVAACKLAGSGKPELSPYYSTDWQPTDAERQPLPIVITLPALYTALLDPLIPVAVQPGEELPVLIARLAKVRNLEREIAALERKIRNEQQFNLKVGMRRTLKAKQAALEMQR